MTSAWRLVIGWREATVAVAVAVAVAVVLATSLHPILTKIRRRSDKPRSGTLEEIAGGDDAEFEYIDLPVLSRYLWLTLAGSSLSTASVPIQIIHGLEPAPTTRLIEPKIPELPNIDLRSTRRGSIYFEICSHQTLKKPGS